MGITSLIGLLIIGLVAGWLAGVMWKGRGFGIVGNIVVGIIGSFIGGVMVRFVGFIPQGTIASIVTAVIGALALLWIINQIKK
ncbi:MAG: GlsB/YeaQ/YmgE family stress response membrane protein [Spirochaetes bacterium]|nr:GlsB/YeaQ/YmgE family stress response membrane protein [Spirochaetota bacterium]